MVTLINGKYNNEWNLSSLLIYASHSLAMAF